MRELLYKKAFTIFETEPLQNYVWAMSKRLDFESFTVWEIYNFALSSDARNTYSVGRLAKGSFGNTLVDMGYKAEGQRLLEFLNKKMIDKTSQPSKIKIFKSYIEGLIFKWKLFQSIMFSKLNSQIN